MTGRWRERLKRWAPPVGFMLLIFILSSFRLGTPRVGRFTHADKIAHAVEYATLTFLLYRAMKESHWPWLCQWAPLAALAVAAIYGATDEVHQHFTGRDMDLVDWLADVFGAACTATVLMAWHHSHADPRRDYPPEKWQ